LWLQIDWVADVAVEVEKTWKMIRDSTALYNPYQYQTKRVILIGGKNSPLTSVVKTLTNQTIPV